MRSTHTHSSSFSCPSLSFAFPLSRVSLPLTRPLPHSLSGKSYRLGSRTFPSRVTTKTPNVDPLEERERRGGRGERESFIDIQERRERERKRERERDRERAREREVY